MWEVLLNHSSVASIVIFSAGIFFLLVGISYIKNRKIISTILLAFAVSFFSISTIIQLIDRNIYEKSIRQNTVLKSDCKQQVTNANQIAQDVREKLETCNDNLISFNEMESLIERTVALGSGEYVAESGNTKFKWIAFLNQKQELCFGFSEEAPSIIADEFIQIRESFGVPQTPTSMYFPPGLRATWIFTPITFLDCDQGEALQLNSCKSDMLDAAVEQISTNGIISMETHFVRL